MDKDAIKELRRRLMEIYRNHDVSGFREFIRERAPEDKRYAPYVDANDEKLSLLMYAMKSRLMYLGDTWQEARNVLRYNQFWKEGELMEQVVLNLPNMPICSKCVYFQQPIPPAVKPCMHMGAIQNDICCPAYKAIKPN
jgi:hypothetical protein